MNGTSVHVGVVAFLVKWTVDWKKNSCSSGS